MTRHAKRERLLGQYVQNILNTYYAADSLSRAAGAEWYRVEGERCETFGAAHGLSRQAVAGAAAAISPGMRWETVFANLAALLLNPNHRVPTYNREFVRRALRCLSGENPMDVLSGDKVTAFYRLLGLPHLKWAAEHAPVVVDGHALNIAQGAFVVFRKRPGYTPPNSTRVWSARYALVADAYRAAAGILEVPPHEVQAATWIFWRSVHA